MVSENDFDEIVSGFHKAAAGTIGWVEALTPFKRAVSAYAVQVLAADLSQGAQCRITLSHHVSDFPVQAEVDYSRKWHQFDPRAHLTIGSEPGQWLNCWDHFDEEFVAHDPFYRDFLIPYGGRYVSGCKLLQEGPVHTMLGVHRGNGSAKFDAEEIAVSKRFARHLSDALHAHRQQGQAHKQSRLGVELLARLRAPVALIDEQRLVLQANPAAHALLERAEAVELRGGHLHCQRPTDDGAFLLGLRRLIQGEPGAPQVEARDSKFFQRATAPASGATVGLYLYALLPSATMHAFGNQPLAMCLFHDPKAQIGFDPYVVASAFDLTPGEARIAVAAAEGASPSEIAKRHAVSVHTVRTQLQSVFGKTGTSRQAELVSLLSGLPMAALQPSAS